MEPAQFRHVRVIDEQAAATAVRKFLANNPSKVSEFGLLSSGEGATRGHLPDDVAHHLTVVVEALEASPSGSAAAPSSSKKSKKERKASQ